MVINTVLYALRTRLSSVRWNNPENLREVVWDGEVLGAGQGVAGGGGGDGPEGGKERLAVQVLPFGI